MTNDPEGSGLEMESTGLQSFGSVDFENFAGMNTADAKEYIVAFITTLKLTEKEICSLEEDAAKWKSRADLSRSNENSALVAEAEDQAEKVTAHLAQLRDEQRTLKEQIETMRRRLPRIAARERSVDPELLQQELLAALGRTGEEAATETAFVKMEQAAASDAALSALKEKMKNQR